MNKRKKRTPVENDERLLRAKKKVDEMKRKIIESDKELRKKYPWFYEEED